MSAHATASRAVCITVFGEGGNGLHNLTSGSAAALRMLTRMYYYEILCCNEISLCEQCCCVFIFPVGAHDNATRVQRWFDTKLSFEHTRVVNIHSDEMLPSLRFIRLQYKVWEQSCLYTPFSVATAMHIAQGVAASLQNPHVPSANRLREQVRTLYSMEAVQALFNADMCTPHIALDVRVFVHRLGVQMCVLDSVYIPTLCALFAAIANTQNADHEQSVDTEAQDSCSPLASSRARAHASHSTSPMSSGGTCPSPERRVRYCCTYSILSFAKRGAERASTDCGRAASRCSSTSHLALASPLRPCQYHLTTKKSQTLRQQTRACAYYAPTCLLPRAHEHASTRAREHVTMSQH